jgi:UDP:flavonoid glycosyltransferase YjiC (YdhE family)
VRWDRKLFGDGRNRCLFVGDLEDVADRGLGIGLPGRRAHAERYYTFLGSVLPFDPADWADRGKVRDLLGYDERPLIIATIGGTAIGHELLELCAAAHPLIRQGLPEAHLVLVCGPNLDPDSIKGGEGIEVRGFVPDLYQHLAACDVAITQAGGTTTLELTALRRPFLYFPLDGHFEQEQVVAERLARQGAGVRMKRERTTPERLATTVVAGYGREAAYRPIVVDGARRAAQEILSLSGGGEAALSTGPVSRSPSLGRHPRLRGL